MAQKRMIDKKISVSEQVSNLPIEAQLIYTWGMPHADDIGLLPSSHRTLKATLVPMWDMELSVFSAHIVEILEQKLWLEYEYKGQKFYRIPNFTRYQILKKDRQPQTILPIEFDKKPHQTWAMLESCGFQLETNGNHLDTEEKRSEEKRSEDKIRGPHGLGIEYLSKLPAEDMSEFLERFHATEREVKSKAEDLKLYCERKGKVYKNYKSFLLNALKRDFKERDGAKVGKYANL